MKKMFLSLLGAAVCVAAAAESYRSAGFSAEIGSNGVIRNLQYAGKALASSISLAGEYAVPEGTEKHDARFFQAWDYANRAEFQRDGETLTVTVDSTLGNKMYKDAAAYRVKCVLTPNEITVSSEVTQRMDLLTNYHMFKTYIVMEPALFGRGIRVMTENDGEEFKVLPESYDSKFRLRGRELTLAADGGLLRFAGDADVRFLFMDSRQWGGKDFTIVVTPFGKWTPKPVLHPAGTVWKWAFRLTFASEGK